MHDAVLDGDQQKTFRGAKPYRPDIWKNEFGSKPSASNSQNTGSTCANLAGGNTWKGSVGTGLIFPGLSPQAILFAMQLLIFAGAHEILSRERDLILPRKPRDEESAFCNVYLRSDEAANRFGNAKASIDDIKFYRLPGKIGGQPCKTKKIGLRKY